MRYGLKLSVESWCVNPSGNTSYISFRDGSNEIVLVDVVLGPGGRTCSTCCIAGTVKCVYKCGGHPPAIEGMTRTSSPS